MNKPLTALQSNGESPVAKKSALIIPMKFIAYKTGRSILPTTGTDFSLAGFRSEGKTGERGWLDYLLIGLLTLSAHFYIVQRFHDGARNELPVTPVKVPPMVQVTLIPPPLPKPIVQPPPPPPPVPKKVEVKKPEPKKAEPPKPVKKEVVAIKPRITTPKPSPKPVVRRVEPLQEPTPPEPEEEEEEEPRQTPVKAAPPPPRPTPVAERISGPSASAGYLHNPTPTYPEIAEEEGWEGRVILKVHVLASGRPDSVSVIKSSGHDVLDQAAIRTVKGSWHFAPAMRGDTPTDGWVSVPINFNLPG